MKKVFLILVFSALFLSGIITFQYIKFNDKKLHIIFCNVGQGDGIFIRTADGTDIIVDGGPNDSILKCVQKNTPFWDKNIELVILSHPHADHLVGLSSIFKYYEVLNFATERLSNNTSVYKELMDNIKKENVKVKYLYSGNKINLGQKTVLNIVSPSKSFLQNTSPNGVIGESGEFASLVSLLSFGNFNLLLTGDVQKEALEDAVSNIKGISLEVLQVPHHGSKTGLNSEIISFLHPQLAVISVGKNNKYGHPSNVILKMFGNIKVFRTDRDGDVEIVSDGKNFTIE